MVLVFKYGVVKPVEPLNSTYLIFGLIGSVSLSTIHPFIFPTLNVTPVVDGIVIPS